MSEQLLCDPCQRLLRGENPRLQKDFEFAHHTTAESFEHALALPCGICRILEAGFSRDMRYRSGGTFQVAPTKYDAASWADRKDDFFLIFDCSKTSIVIRITSKATIDSMSQVPPAGLSVIDEGESLASGHTGSDVCISFALSEFRRCQYTHTRCRMLRQNQVQMGHFLPTRLLDVGSAEASAIHLVETGDHPKDTSYCALSHCWGDSQPLRLTRTTATSLKTGIQLTELPKTFQDAVHVARKMQVQYLWIDSLCIIQDDPEDWQREAAQMRDVYSRAICCIAATAAKDSNAGLFFDRNPHHLSSVTVESTKARIYGRKTNEPLVAYCLRINKIWPGEAIDDAPLNQRAWVAQERYLSTGTIHFTQELLFWECHECMTSEQEPELIQPTSLGSRVNEYKIRKASEFLDLACTDPLALNEIYDAWCHFRAAYSSCYLTNENDILVALNGVAQDVAGVLNDTLIAGLWRNRLIEDLCWMRSQVLDDVFLEGKTTRPAVWRAPTWSWASIIRGGLRVAWLGKKTDMVKIEAVFADQKSSGELVNASMTLKCRMIPVRLSKQDGRRPTICEFDRVEITLDDPTQLADEVSLIILCRSDVEDESRTVAHGILLSPSRTKAGSYERVGYFDIRSWLKENMGVRELQVLLDAHHSAEETTIELI